MDRYILAFAMVCYMASYGGTIIKYENLKKEHIEVADNFRKTYIDSLNAHTSRMNHLHKENHSLRVENFRLQQENRYYKNQAHAKKHKN